MAEERLQKIIARGGVASRREAESLIREGRVTVNGKVVDELGSKADPAVDHVKVDGKLITRPEPHRYILLYKPKEVMTTVDDPEGRRTVIDLVRGVKERIFPVGRLDYHTEGLIILTNDGELAFRIAHPSHGSVKTYHVKVRGVPSDRLIDKLQRGITIDGRRTIPCEIERTRTTGRSDEEGNSWFEVRLREGRTHQIRKMFQAIGHPVTKLKRVAIGPVSDSKLSAGDWRELTPAEVELLRTVRDAAPKQRKRPVRVKAESASPAAKRSKGKPGGPGRVGAGKPRTASTGSGGRRTSTKASAAVRATRKRATPATSSGQGRSGSARKSPARKKR